MEGCERGEGRCWMNGEQEPRGGRSEVQNDSRRHGKPTFPLKHSLNLSGRETGSAKPRGGLVLCCLGKSRRESERAADNPTALVLPGGQASPLTSSVSLDFFLSVKETSLCRTLFFLCPSIWVLCKARGVDAKWWDASAEQVLSLPPLGSCKRPLILRRECFRDWWEPEVWTHIPVPLENPGMALNFVDIL